MHVGEDWYQGRKQWAEEIKTLANGRPVFLPDNLREASLYSFYSSQQGVTLYTRPGKKSQYELWGYEDSLQGKEVVFLSKYPHPNGTKISMALGKDFYWSVVPQFQSYYNGIGLTATIEVVTKDSVEATLTLTNRSGKPVSFEKGTGNDYIGFVYSIEQKRNVLKSNGVLALTKDDGLAPGARLTKRVAVPVGDLRGGEFELYFGIRSGLLPDAILSEPVVFRR